MIARRQYVSPYRCMLDAAFGVIATFYGRHFTYFILLSKIFRTEGFAAFIPVLADIFEHFKRMRVVISGELQKPEVQEARGAAAQVVRRVASLQQAFAAAQAGQDSSASDRFETELAEVRYLQHAR